MEVTRATNPNGKTYRIMDDGNPLFFSVYTIERRCTGLWNDGTEWWELEPSSPITSDLQEITSLFYDLINA